MPSSPLRVLRTRTKPFALALTFLAVAAFPAGAQTVVGTVSRPSVTVDLSVLDALGPPPAATARTDGSGALPPRKKKAAEAKPARPKPEVAARRAAPVAPVAASGKPVPRENVTQTPLADAPSAAPAPPATENVAAAAPAAATAALAPSASLAPTTPPPASLPSALPSAAPSPAAMTAMSTPPSVAPVAPAPAPMVTPAAALATVGASGGGTRIVFSAGNADLPDGAKSDLDALVKRLNDSDRVRLQLVAYASGTAEEANQARRVSLQRALAVRSYLMERGVPNTRMDVRALGNRTDGKDPPDRVDIVMVER